MAATLPLAWGATEADLARDYPADTMLSGPVLRLTRAVAVDAPPETTWRWLCQIAVAPYSYDLLDNRGRPSPSVLTPGADDLRVGQLMMIFRLTDVDPGHHWSGVTTRAASRLFGEVAVTYAAEPDGDGSRIVCRMLVGQAGPFEWVRSRLLAWGDLVMMRKQLLTLRALAERDARR